MLRLISRCTAVAPVLPGSWVALQPLDHGLQSHNTISSNYKPMKFQQLNRQRDGLMLIISSLISSAQSLREAHWLSVNNPSLKVEEKETENHFICHYIDLYLNHSLYNSRDHWGCWKNSPYDNCIKIRTKLGLQRAHKAPWPSRLTKIYIYIFLFF